MSIMKQGNKKAIIMAMIGAIIGIMLGIVFSKSDNALAIIPVAGVIGGLIGTVVGKKRNKN